jgi:hypothetical protein
MCFTHSAQQLQLADFHTSTAGPALWTSFALASSGRINTARAARRLDAFIMFSLVGSSALGATAWSKKGSR